MEMVWLSVNGQFAYSSLVIFVNKDRSIVMKAMLHFSSIIGNVTFTIA